MESKFPEGDAILNIGHDGFTDGDEGTGRLTLRNGAVINFDAGDAHFCLSVGGGAGSIAQLYVTGGSVIEMDVANAMTAGPNARSATSAHRSGLVVIDGPDVRDPPSRFRRNWLRRNFDNFSLPGGHGTLMLNNGAQITVDNSWWLGPAARSVAGTGRSTAAIVLTMAARSTCATAPFGTFDVNSDVFIENAGNGIFLDIGANDGNANTQDGDLIRFNGGLVPTRRPVHRDDQRARRLQIRHRRNARDRRTQWQRLQSADLRGHQPACRLRLLCRLLPTANAGEIVVQALNSGLNGGFGTLDFGAGWSSRLGLYNASTNNGTVFGGRLGHGGVATNVDQFLGTNLNDMLRITVAGSGSRAFTLDGRGGADNLLGGAGADRLFGGAGNER